MKFPHYSPEEYTMPCILVNELCEVIPGEESLDYGQIVERNALLVKNGSAYVWVPIHALIKCVDLP
jgi:hypothetical protein